VTGYRRAVYAFSGLFVVLGVALLVRTALAGGGQTGYLLGAMFVALGAARIALQRTRRGG